MKYIIRGTICLKLLYSGSIVAKIKVNEKGGERLCDIVIRKLNKKLSQETFEEYNNYSKREETHGELWLKLRFNGKKV